ncbi:MAG TPA: molecular chaperone TorD family protein [Nevskia sp.]|nr:molecular chaperone TorD family protein [Nevskia sp.]
MNAVHVPETCGPRDGSWADPRTREQLYHFLGAAYLRPLTQDALHRLLDASVLDELAAVFGEQAIAALRGFATGRNIDCEHLRQEFMDLFAVPSGLQVTPFEDVYRGASAGQRLGPLLGEHAVAVKRLYRPAGGEVGESCTELPTHVGVELSFMSFLCAREAAVCGMSDGASAAEPPAGSDASFYRTLQIRFLREHLNAWFPRLRRAIRERASSDLYRGLADLTQVVLERDADVILFAPPTESRQPHSTEPCQHHGKWDS